MSIMRTAIQSFFLVQVIFERAFERLTEIGSSVTRQYVRTPLQQSLRDFIGANDNSDSDQLRTEVDSIRTELHSLRRDVRDLQKTPV
jgi:hypothetical protein